MSTTQTKQCSKCGEIKSLDEFHKSSRDGYKSKCKTCRKVEAKTYWNNNKTYITEYREQNKDHILNYRKEYYIKNKEYIKSKSKAYRKNNKNKCRQKDYKYRKTRREIDPIFKLTCDLRSTIHNRIKTQRGIKSIKTKELLGCNIEIVRFYLECQFLYGMTWENHGIHGWHIDHIRPCSSFDLTDPEQQKECFHYTNLQPLWAEDNLSKGDKW